MDIFYRLIDDPEEIIKECKDLAFDIVIERKDENYKRVSDPTSFDDLLKIFSESKMYWVFIKRHSGIPAYCDIKKDGTVESHKVYYEVGGCTLDKKLDYFLFIYLFEEVGDQLIEKYQLKPLNT